MQTPLKNSAFLYIDPLINFSLNIKQHYTICIFYMYAILQLSHVFHNHKRSLVFYYLQGQRPTQRVPDLHVPLAPTLTSTGDIETFSAIIHGGAVVYIMLHANLCSPKYKTILIQIKRMQNKMRRKIVLPNCKHLNFQLIYLHAVQSHDYGRVFHSNLEKKRKKNNTNLLLVSNCKMKSNLLLQMKGNLS